MARTEEEKQSRANMLRQKLAALRADMREEFAKQIRKALAERCRSCALDDDEDFEHVVKVAAEAAVVTFLNEEGP